MKGLLITSNKKIWFSLSLIVIMTGIVFMVNNIKTTGAPFNLGIDFTGGTNILLNVQMVEDEFVKNNNVADKQLSNKVLEQIKTVIKANGITHLQVTTVDKYYFSLKMSELTGKEKDILIKNLNDKLGKIEILEVDFIGPTIGNELKKQSVTIVVIAVLLLLTYITFRFEFRAAIAAIIALVHDALIVLGLAAILRIEVDTAFVAAILTILGYSINDTIVIFDRIRENFVDATESAAVLVEKSIRQTITRSVNTSVTTLVVLLSIYLFGGGSLKGFALVLFIGITSGTYSSIFIASPLFEKFKKIELTAELVE